MDIVIAADRLRRRALGYPPITKKPWQRVWMEPPFNVLGLLFGQLMRAFPWPVRQRLDLWIIEKLGRHPIAFHPDLTRRASQAAQMARQLRDKTGQWPAMLVLTSHPPTVGPLEWLRFSLICHGLVLADAVAEAERPGDTLRSHPECLLAIDPFALDTLTTPVAGFYAGWMHRLYLAWDRQPGTQSRLQSHMLLRRTGYSEITYRLLSRLNDNIPVIMVVAGGLPHNARLLYAVREWVQQLPAARWPRSKRTFEKEFMERAARPIDGVRPPERGLLPVETQHEMRALLSELLIPGAEQNRLLHELSDEFQREIPYRVRLFECLASRLARKGKPLLLMALSHRQSPPHVQIAEPWSLRWEGESYQLGKGSLEAEGPIAGPAEWARAFGKLFEIQ